MIGRSYHHPYRYGLRDPRFYDPAVSVMQIHDQDCDCEACLPYVPSDPSRLGAVAMGKLAVVGALVATGFAFLYDAAGAAAALRATVGL